MISNCLGRSLRRVNRMYALTTKSLPTLRNLLRMVLLDLSPPGLLLGLELKPPGLLPGIPDLPARERKSAVGLPLRHLGALNSLARLDDGWVELLVGGTAELVEEATTPGAALCGRAVGRAAAVGGGAGRG